MPLLRFMACSLFGFAPYPNYGAVMKSYNKRTLKLLNATTLKNAFHP
ncbi:hypothetical protein HPHPH6_0115 [Helicobacter pylori Hp H-6]|uniref:Uncharacterized protein n=1 Tax=Helicobacter pylori Hp H-6 TaxID=992061 RepID=J0DAN1_HELPX|nr:hypothetical protein HPHPH6_0115 [Helicobacter pylori Hp H-6]